MQILRKIIELNTKLLGFSKRNRQITPEKNSEVKINLGCGLTVTQGWLNVDGSLNALIASWPYFIHWVMYSFSGSRQFYTCEEYCRLLRENKFIHHDLSYGIPFIDNSVDFVYSSHFLEHLYLEDALNLLNESYRVLKPGGTIRICVPDLAYAISLYSEGEKEKMLNTYFFVEPKGSDYARHKYMYDFEIMKETLAKAGFENIVRCKYQQGLTPNLDQLDNRPEETLFVEAMKTLKK